MAKYVMSDIHGCYDEFINMLKLIDFKDEDELYILGDIIDRGPEPLLILDYILNSNNITMLIGNHEDMFNKFYEDNDTGRWYRNGGQATHEQIKLRDAQYQENMYKYFSTLPFIKVIDKYILVHGGLEYGSDCEELEALIEAQIKYKCIWSRENIGSERRFKDYTVICGHTPVQSITDSNYNSILFRDGVIYIDCGCVYKEENGRLGCLRLDDMMEFYV